MLQGEAECLYECGQNSQLHNLVNSRLTRAYRRRPVLFGLSGLPVAIAQSYRHVVHWQQLYPQRPSALGRQSLYKPCRYVRR